MILIIHIPIHILLTWPKYNLYKISGNDYTSFMEFRNKNLRPYENYEADESLESLENEEKENTKYFSHNLAKSLCFM